MTDAPDRQLLEEFVRNNSEEAFAALIQRHVALVHSVAMRHTMDPQLAEDITQAVFILLARKAAGLGRKIVLAGWLYHAARLIAANLQRAELRRIRREQEAFMQSNLEESPTNSLWRELSPLLEPAMATLGASDRDALVLRYFQNRSMAEVGAALGCTENTAQKRVGRALEKLRRFFGKKGVVLFSPGVLAAHLAENSVRAAPAGVATKISTVAALKGAAASTSTLTLVQGAQNIMAWTKAKTAIVIAAVALLLATSTTILAGKLAQPPPPAAGQADPLLPLQEIITADIKPNTAISFRATFDVTNANSRLPASVQPFDGADTISRVFDESGKRLKFKKVRGTNTFLITLPRPVPPGGTFSYTVEGAITRSIRKFPRGTVREFGSVAQAAGDVADLHYVETWRLPPGATLVDTGPGMAATTNAGRTELLIDQILPPNSNLTNNFAYKL